MVKTLNSIVSDVTDNALTSTVRDTANQIWLAGLGAFAMAQEEGTKMFDALVKDGEKFQGRTKKAATETFSDMSHRTSGSLDKIEQVFQDRVARALKVLGVPSSKDISALSDRVAELAEAVARLSGDVPATLPDDDSAATQDKPHGKSGKGTKAAKADAPAEEVLVP
jgi:poly(hydroxyalkanoate) granule-associated protein